MGQISYVGTFPDSLTSTLRVVLMQEMGKLWKKWPEVCEASEVDTWRWGSLLSHYKAADRWKIVKNAHADAISYEREVNRVEKHDPDMLLVKHMLEQATYVIRDDEGLPLHTKV